VLPKQLAEIRQKITNACKQLQHIITMYISETMLARKHKNQRGLSSGGKFSLKGTTTNVGYIGQTRHNSDVRTVFKGNEPVGFGGCCGTYKREILCNNRVSCGTSTSSSTLTTSGYISTRVTNPIVKNVDKDCPMKWVKSFNPLEHAQSYYVHKVKVAAACVVTKDDAGVKECTDGCRETYYIGTRKMTRSVYSKTGESGAMSAGEYTDTVLYSNNCLPTPPCKQPFPMILNNTDTCAKFYMTPQEAQSAGLLPADWMNCKTATAFSSNPYQ
jgi:hypothetical protein